MKFEFFKKKNNNKLNFEQVIDVKNFRILDKRKPHNFVYTKNYIYNGISDIPMADSTHRSIQILPMN